MGCFGTRVVLIPVQSVETDEQRNSKQRDLRGYLGEGLLLGGVDVHRIREPKQKREMRLATLSVLKFNDPYGADLVLVALQGMQERQMITLEDAAVVSWPQGNKKPKT